MSHLSHDELSARLDDALSGAARERVDRHLAECAECREALAALAAQDRALRPALEHDPGDAYFEDFAARVEDRIRAAGLTGAQSRLGGGGLWAWLGTPRRLAWVGAAAAVVAGTGIVVLSSREVQRPSVDALLEARSGQTAAKEQAAPAPPGGAAANRVERGATSPPPVRPAEDELVRKKSGAEVEDRTLARREAGRPADHRLAAPTAEPPAAAAAPSRLQAVKRTAAGEDVPVASNERKLAAAPEQEMARSDEADLKQAKPRAATPLTKSESRDALSGAAPPAGSALDLAKDAIQLCGQVMDDRGRPVSGAVVALVDRGTSATADAQGRFCLAGPAGVHSLTAMAVGYAATRLQVRLEGEMAEALVTMHAVPVLEGQGASGSSSLAKGLIDRGPPAGSLQYFSQPPAGEVAVATRRAERATRAADSLATATAYDAAATAWARVVPVAAEGSRLEARYRLAESRFQAWRLGPTATRTRAARAAVDAFLREAPPGPQRDLATAWRERIR